MNPFIKRTLEDHKKELNEIISRNTPLIAELEKERAVQKSDLSKTTRKISNLRQEIINKKYYVSVLE
jgi:hypothetical protein